MCQMLFIILNQTVFHKYPQPFLGYFEDTLIKNDLVCENDAIS